MASKKIWCALLLLMAPLAWAGKATIFSGSDVKALKQNLDLNGQAKVKTGTADPTVTPQSAPQGSIYLRTGGSGGSAYMKQDAGSTTNWALLASSASPTGASTVTVVDDYSVLPVDDIILVNTASKPGASTINITLPLASGRGGKKFYIKKIDTGASTVTILPSGGDLLDAETSQVYYAPFTAVTWGSDGGTNWFAF